VGLGKKVAVTTSLTTICFLLLLAGNVYAQTPAAASISISSPAGPVGSKLTLTGAGYPPNASLLLEWNSANASWIVGGSPPQVTGTKVVPTEKILGSAQTNASGSFSAQITLPPDFGMQHVIQAYASNGTAFAPKAIYTLEPQFSISPTSGPDGTPITVTGTGMGDSLYSTNYHVSWDNNYVGYATAITSQGSTSFTIYASGVPGTHYVAIYQGYPGPGYLNAQQIPVASQSQSYFPAGCTMMTSCTIPYDVNFTVTDPTYSQATSGSSNGMVISGSIALAPLLVAVVALLGGALFVSRQDPERRKAISRGVAAIVVIVVLAVAGVALFASVSQGSTSSTSSTSSASHTPTSSQTSTTPQISYTPVASVDRPQITVPVFNTATTGPRISVTPEIVSVGSTITVSGQGFASNTQLPLTWSTRQGSNLLGYKLVALPLKNVTTASDGSFSFTTKVHSDVGGIHFIAAGNLTENSNGTVFLQRTGTISATQGPAGTKIVISFVGVGWDYNTNLITVDYDNSYVGYGCGFNTGGNTTITVFAAGAPGIHDIDVYPSIWWGASGPTAQQVTIYRYPLLTPQDHPELMPSFHFTFLITGGSTASG